MALGLINAVWQRLSPRRAYAYQALHVDSTMLDAPQERPSIWSFRARPILKIAAAATVLGTLVYLIVPAKNGGSQTCNDTPTAGFQCSPPFSHHWGQYSPYFSVAPETCSPLPAGCEITFAQLLSRHGARDPTASKTAAYKKTIERIHESVREYGKGYEFIEQYQYELGADQLSLFGQQQMIHSGIQFYNRYQYLARSESPFVRSSGQQRVVDSAVNWTLGFHQSRTADRGSAGPDNFPYSIVTIEEAPGVNNTLSHGLCLAFEEGEYSQLGRDAEATFMDVFAPAITARLNQNLPGANLSNMEAIYLMDLCPFESVADTHGGRTLSPFCGLFSADEWRRYDYYQSLGKWYGMGDGNPLGPTQGVGWANELVARLTGRPVRDGTSTNATLDGAPATFPLGRALYADFTHDHDMVAVFAALGLWNGTRAPDKTALRTPAQMGGFSASRTVPFAARMHVEKMRCDGGTGGRVYGGEVTDEELVRILINGRVIPLQNCGADKLGRCTLSSFVESLGFARSGGEWARCFP